MSRTLRWPGESLRGEPGTFASTWAGKNPSEERNSHTATRGYRLVGQARKACGRALTSKPHVPRSRWEDRSGAETTTDQDPRPPSSRQHTHPSRGKQLAHRSRWHTSPWGRAPIRAGVGSSPIPQLAPSTTQTAAVFQKRSRQPTGCHAAKGGLA